ncbi:hypothetical protein PYCCODRAFT_665627 [Trametes coccinea BRFM310]|uniref:BTB domain-containing protein n=1 Tax=Trametes coccinea (strain BRFM310) TaxID=1353009 RepID=A0A1Y2IJQ7_TRAC3|nr:hypothetical protein PYCCODRAFT_665627 [Trametes coccinea BRFM310]
MSSSSTDTSVTPALNAPQAPLPQYTSLPPPLKWDPCIRFPDGDVTLVAEGFAFRLHQGMLASQSEVFESWFAGPRLNIPHPHHIGWLDGQPLVALRPFDTAHDFREVLMAIYGVMRLESVTTYSVAAGLRRFAHAYRMTTLADAVHDLLDPTFPTDIHGWDAPSASRVSFDLGAKQAIEAYNLSKFTKDRHALAAVYRCAQLREADLRKGTKRLDGTPEVLAAHDLRTVLKARSLLKQLGARALRESRAIRAVGGPDCVRMRCQEAFGRGILPIKEDAAELANGHVASRWADKEIAWAQRWEMICPRCAEHARAEHLRIREALWEAFARSVGLPQAGSLAG